MNEEKKVEKWYWRDGVILLIVMILVFSIMGSVTTFTSIVYNFQLCPTLQAINTAPGFTYKWGFWTGCRVQIPSGLWVPQSDLDKYLSDPPLSKLPKEFIK